MKNKISIFNCKKDIYIYGTGTDVGKTYVSATMLNQLHQVHNNDYGYFKPVVSGGLGDAVYVKEKCRLSDKASDLVTYCSPMAASPHLAFEGTKIEVDGIISNYNRLKSIKENLIIEGCGGIFCPIDLSDRVLLQKDIEKLFDTHNVLVANSELGTLNSIFTSLAYAKENNVQIFTIIMNCFDKNNFIHADNLKTLQRLKDDCEILTLANNSDILLQPV